MPKRSVINKLKKKSVTPINLYNRRRILNLLLKKNLVLVDLQNIYKIVRKIDINSSRNRFRNFCWHTGRISGIINYFGLSRLSLRLMGQWRLLPGLKKAQW